MPTLVHALSCTKSNSTTFSPYFLMFGRKLQIPIDLQFGLQVDKMVAMSYHQFMRQLQERLTLA